MLDRASYVGTLLGLRKEKNLLGVLIGAVNTFKEKRTGDSAAVSLKTYYAADDNGRWVNHLDGNPLTDWTNINAAEQASARSPTRTRASRSSCPAAACSSPRRSRP